ENDTQSKDLFGQALPSKLPRELADIKARQKRLNKALEVAKKKAEEANKTKKVDSKPKKEPCVPIAEPDARILPNKEGGYAPNYTVLSTAESQNGFIMDADVIIGSDEGNQTLNAIDRIEENFGQKPENLTADTAFSNSANLVGLEERDVAAYMPQYNRPDQKDNPANRENPTEPIPAELWDQLPRDTQSKKLHRTALAFDETANCYYCPMGRKLDYLGKNTKKRKYGEVLCYRYRSKDCSLCELSEQCRNGEKIP
ncbi:MAG: hypothetical protein GY799_22620, partial [Desulfobulbaceae bacterium]|nr:hypothetical protein [Desulfobulbaceae bacterium]